MRVNILAYILLFIFSVITAFSSIYLVTDTAYQKEDLAHMEYGWPIRFMTKDMTRYDPPFPWAFRGRLLEEVPMEINNTKFLLNFSIHFVVLIAFFTLFKKYNPLKR